MSVYEKHIMIEPRLPFIFHDHHRDGNYRAGVANWHENIELLCFTEGNATVTCNELRLVVHSGDVVILNANCIHDILPHNSVHFYCLIIDRSFCLSNHFDTNLLRFQPLANDRVLFDLICNVAAEYKNKDTPYRIQAIRAGTLAVLTFILRHYATEEEKPYADTRLLSSVKLALGYISSECHRPLTLDMIAKESGLSKFYLAREFHRLTGKTVVDYIHICRCEKAKQMLAEKERTIEEIAHACGFSNFSYFTKTFTRIVGTRPSAYRARFREQ